MYFIKLMKNLKLLSKKKGWSKAWRSLKSYSWIGAKSIYWFKGNRYLWQYSKMFSYHYLFGGGMWNLQHHCYGQTLSDTYCSLMQEYFLQAYNITTRTNLIIRSTGRINCSSCTKEKTVLNHSKSAVSLCFA